MKREMRRLNKKAAMELSISTIVIVVLAMSMLILGLVLIKNIFIGVNENVLSVNDKVKGEINKLFTDENRVVVSTNNGIVNVKVGQAWGIPFGIKNDLSEQAFKWEVKLDQPDAKTRCKTTSNPQSWVSTGGTGSRVISSNGNEVDIIIFKIPSGEVMDVPNCLVRYVLEVKKADGGAYQTIAFNVQAT
jgi:hypothetical protein